MKIKGRNIINTSQYSFIRTAHETKFIFLFDLIMYVWLIMYLDLLRCLFDLIPCDSHEKNELFATSLVHILNGLKTCWLIYKRDVSEKQSSSSAGVSERILMDLYYVNHAYKQIYLQTWKTVTWREWMRWGAQAGLHELVEVWGEKGKHISLCV